MAQYSIIGMNSVGQKSLFWTRDRFVIVILTVVGVTIQSASYSVINSFYPKVAKSRGNDATKIGIVFSMYPFIGFVSSPLIGKLLSSGMKMKTLLVIGTFLDGCALTAMLVTEWILTPFSFFVASTFFRSLEALGFSACLTCYYTLVSNMFPEKVQIMVPLVETVFGIGSMIGPAAGQILAKLGGYQLPFIVFGCCSVNFALALAIFLPTEEEPKKIDKDSEKFKSKLRMSHLIKDHRIVLDIIAVVVGCLSIGFHNSTLALWIEQFDLTMTMSTVIFLTYGIIYGLASFVNGFISEKFDDCRVLILVGGLCLVGGLAILGPIPLLSFSATPVLIIVGQFLMGIGNGAVYNLSHVHALKYVVTRLGYAPGPETYSIVACAVSAGFFFGAFAGPIIGGFLYDTIGYRWASFVICLIVALPISPMYLSVARDHFRGTLQSKPQTNGGCGDI